MSIKGTLRETGATSQFPNLKQTTVMSFFVMVTSVLVGCFSIAGQTQLEELVPGFLRGIPAVYPEKTCDGTLSAVCANCDTIKLCINPTVDSMNPRQQCPKSLPYCNMLASVTGAVCQINPDTSVDLCTTINFKCTGVGYFPDPYLCQTFYYCKAPAVTPEVYHCPNGYMFSSKVKGCISSAEACPTFTCKEDTTYSIFQPLPSSTQFYVHCIYDKSVTPAKLTDTLVFSCGEGANFNPTSGKCVFTCPAEGLYANTAYPKLYYQCYRSAGKLIYKDLACPVDKQFDAKAKRCVALPAPPGPIIDCVNMCYGAVFGVNCDSMCSGSGSGCDKNCLSPDRNTPPTCTVSCTNGT